MTSPIGTIEQVAAVGYDNNTIGPTQLISVTATAPVAATTGENPVISIAAATALVPGSTSAADFTKLAALVTPSYGGTYEFNETGSAIALTSSVAFYRWITGQAGTVKGTGYVTWDNAAAPTGKRLTVGASGAGKYFVMATFSGNLTLKGDLEAVIYVNAAIQDNIRSDQKVIEDAQYTAGTVAGIVTLAAGDTVSLWFGSSVNSNTFTLKHANLTLQRIDV